MKSNTYYLESPDIHVDNKTLLINDVYYPVKNTESIYLYGSYEIHSSLINLLNRENVILHFGDFYGNYNGSYYPAQKKYNNKLILQQYRVYTENLSTGLMETKMTKEYIKLIASTLTYYDRIGYINLDAEKLREVKDLNNTKKFISEAQIKKFYYSYFKTIVNIDGWEFEERILHSEQQDPINSLLSFIYSLIYKDTINSLYKQGFDPRISYVHAVNNRGINTLQYDISDHYKLLLGDRLVIKLIRGKKITKDMFEDNGYIKQKQIKTIIRFYDEYMNKKHKYNIGMLTGKQVIDQQVRIYKNYLLNEEKLMGIKLR